jgi:hypothetical protein
MAWSLAHGFCHIPPPATSGDGDERMGMMMNSTNSMMNGVGRIPRNHLPHVPCATAQSRKRSGPSSWRCTMNEHGSALLRKLVAPGQHSTGERGAGGKGNDQRWRGTASSGSAPREAAPQLICGMHAGRQAVIDMPQWLQGRLRKLCTS